MSKKIGVLGCGWLGLPLAIDLINEGYTVHGSTTSEEKIGLLKNEGIIPFVIAVSEDRIAGNISDFLKDIDILFINIPPKLRGINPENYVKKNHLLHQEIKKAKVTHVIFISSTSVYGDVEGVVTEKTKAQPTTKAGVQLLEAENIFHSDADIKTTIIRFGGLVGGQRHPIRMLSGKTGLKNGNIPVNLIHLNDCIAIVKVVLKCSWWNEIINGVHPEHPTKKEYYTAAAIAHNVQPPEYILNDEATGKIVYSAVLNQKKGFIFKTTP